MTEGELLIEQPLRVIASVLARLYGLERDTWLQRRFTTALMMLMRKNGIKIPIYFTACSEGRFTSSNFWDEDCVNWGWNKELLEQTKDMSFHPDTTKALDNFFNEYRNMSIDQLESEIKEWQDKN